MTQACMQVVQSGQITSTSGEQVDFVWVTNWLCAAVVAPPTKAAFQAAMDPIIQPLWGPILNIAYTGNGHTLRRVDDATDPPVLIGNFGGGTATGDMEDSKVTAYVELLTAKKGKQYRGAIHFGPISEGDTNIDELTAGMQTKVNAMRTALLAGFTDSLGNNWKLVVLSKKPPGQYLVNPVTLNVEVVTSSKLKLQMGSMKRRKATSTFIP